MSNGWPIVKLAEVLRLELDSTPTDAAAYYSIAGVYSFGRGLLKRGPLSGSDTTYRSFNRLHAGDLVISQPKAWEGAIAVVTDEFDGWFVSPVFPTFRAQAERADIRFIDWYCKRVTFWTYLERGSRGIGARRNSVSPEQFLSSEIPLPPLAEQRRIVAKIEQLASNIDEAKGLRGQSELQVVALAQVAQNRIVKGDAPVHPLRHLIAPGTTLSYGVLVPGPDVDDGVPFVRIQDLDPRNPATIPNKRISADIAAQYSRTTLEGGEVLLAVVGATIGKVGIVPESWKGASIARAVCRIVPGPDIDRDYLIAVLLTSEAQDYFAHVTRTLAQPTLNVGQLAETRIPLPPLPEQRRIVAYLDDLQAKVDQLKSLQAQTAAELDALLPSILDRAFRGEL